MSAFFCGFTDKGKIRDNNEDRFIAKSIWNDNYVLAVVIDGVGGHEGGEIAAEIARDTITSYLELYKNGDCQLLLKLAVNEANKNIFIQRGIQPEYSNMSCVLTACIIDLYSQKLFLAHVGDTRLYTYKNKQLTKLSHDHSLVGYKEEINELTEEEAMNHPQRNIIGRDIGSELHSIDDEFFIEISSYEIDTKCTFLLCSDGLSDMLKNIEMSKILQQESTLEEKSQKLIEEANTKGGKDNITVVLISIDAGSEKYDSVTSSVEKEKLQDLEFNDKNEENIEIVKAHAQEENLHTQKKKYLLIKFIIILIVTALIVFLSIRYFSININSTIDFTNKDSSLLKTKAIDTLDLQTVLNNFLLTNKITDTFKVDIDTVRLSTSLVIPKRINWVQGKPLYIINIDTINCKTGLLLFSKVDSSIIKNVSFIGFQKSIIDLGKGNQLK